MRERMANIDKKEAPKVVQDLFQTMMLTSVKTLPSQFVAGPELLVTCDEFVQNFILFYGDHILGCAELSANDRSLVQAAEQEQSSQQQTKRSLLSRLGSLFGL